ncbi:preprotein translocase subunit SecE [Candidatus Kaiserbacteria bacterium]|nr:preprotein translocase subunit SecE [Candidatus Kaiserbacteria bacterium]
MAGIVQYLKDTQGELRHVAWPTRLQTIVYTVLVALISVGIALYLGLFDYIFTTGLTRAIGATPSPSAQTQQTSGSPVTVTPEVNFTVPGATGTTAQ